MDRKKFNRKYLWLLPLLFVAAVSGCWLFSGTWVIIYAVDKEDIDTSEHFHKFTVDLTKESVWQDHKDDLDNIEDVAFTFKLINPFLSPATGQVYVSSDSTLSDSAAVASSATIILDGITIPGGDSIHVTMAHYYDLLQNFETLRGLVKSGVFTAYALVPAPLAIELRNVVVVVTFSAGL
ncbi:MAG: hypothetical protein AMJ91_06540 [candidate division Zixibacteria bacterium SM23_73_3]|nr:MAG: hypothetical protein AMJ91_06540 [candidate division Zixibacteria bacterium SM23_73_3]